MPVPRLAHRHSDGFYFGVVAQGVFAEFAADAAHFEAAERGGGVEDVVAVDPDGASAELGGEAVGFGDVAGPDGGGQAVHGAVTAGDHFVDVLEGDDGHDRAENLFAGDFHFIFDVGENCRLDEVALLADALAAGEHVGAAFSAGFDVAHHLVELLLADLWALV